MPQLPTVALSLIALAAPPGCSALFVDAPPPEHARLPYFDCTSSRMPQTTDIVLAGVMGLAAIGAAQDPNSGSATLVVAGIGAALLGSGIHGSMKTSSCRNAKAGLALRLNEAATSAAHDRPPVDPWLAGGPPPQAPSKDWKATGASNGTTTASPPGHGPSPIQPVPPPAPNLPPP